MPNKIRFMYIRGCLPDYVLTLAYQQKDKVAIGWAINKSVNPKTLHLDQRLRKVTGQKEFNELQKKFIKAYKGDQFNKKVARTIAIGRLNSSNGIFQERTVGTTLLEDALTGVLKSQRFSSSVADSDVYTYWWPYLNEALAREQAREKSYSSSSKNEAVTK